LYHLPASGWFLPFFLISTFAQQFLGYLGHSTNSFLYLGHFLFRNRDQGFLFVFYINPLDLPFSDTIFNR